MTVREKKLALAVGGIVLTFGILFGGYRLLVAPLTERDKMAADLEKKIGEYSLAIARDAQTTARLRGVMARAFDGNGLEIGSHLMQLVERSGLNLLKGKGIEPVAASAVVGSRKDRIAVWSVPAEGKLAQAVDFLFLLKEDPHVHRIESLHITPNRFNGTVTLELRYGVLMPDRSDKALIPASGPASQPASNLDSPGRGQYGLIASRDIFRPYIKRPPAPKPAEAPVAEAFRPSERTDDSGRFKVAALTCWYGTPEVNVLDTQTNSVSTYKVGDSLPGVGRILAVDYREMPLPEDKETICGSRVIAAKGGEYWAVERGHSISQKHRLTYEQLPSELQTKPAAPSGTASSQPEQGVKHD